MPQIKKTKPQFGATINVPNLSLYVEFEDETLETALANAKKLTFKDIIELPANVSANDYDGLEVVGIHKF